MGAERTLAARDLQGVNGLLVPMPKKPEENENWSFTSNLMSPLLSSTCIRGVCA